MILADYLLLVYGSVSRNGSEKLQKKKKVKMGRKRIFFLFLLLNEVYEGRKKSNGGREKVAYPLPRKEKDLFLIFLNDNFIMVEKRVQT